MKQITCPHCGDTYPDFDVAHVCSKGPYAPKLKPKMNERIKLLAEQAGYVPLEPRTFADDLQDIFLKKFAELIVAEMHRKVIASILITDVLMEEKGQKPTSEDYIRALNKDFGVEE